jgi:hypothetical protein
LGVFKARKPVHSELCADLRNAEDSQKDQQVGIIIFCRVAKAKFRICSAHRSKNIKNDTMTEKA